ncbi:hypothetical protein CQR40_00295 [Enterococcus faecium]|nr:hypothetical protein [Enterococcus faecium]MBC6484356.1 hypothetical protein [Enterococcus faecium]PHL07737.1 hypothetical protein CQR42_05425 [Enterococcus faecium]PHL14199.1 hypothetical protein CQR40_00295 [Enterococcus faecium]
MHENCFFKFLLISAYFRRSCFCFRRLYVFRAWDKSVLYFCPTLFWLCYLKLTIIKASIKRWCLE